MIGGRLSDPIVLEQRVITENSIGQKEITWVAETGHTFAEVDRLSETNAQFIIRYRSDIGPETHRILWDSVIWSVTSVFHDRRRTMLTIRSDFSDQIEVTNFQSTEREYIDGLPNVNS
jgi:head-tail adaptor